jgi:hypothetical protein
MSENKPPKASAPPPKPSPDEDARSAAQEHLDDQRELLKKLRQKHANCAGLVFPQE